jgi:predicted nuclease of predicted toxin-antitoxin system
LVDENVAPRVTAYLRQQADVRDVKEEGWFGWTDEALLGLAQREGRIVVTYDVNFAGLKRLRQDHHGIIFIRLQNMRADSVVAALQTFLAEHGYRNLSNTLATIQETRTRFRRTR